MKLPAIRLLTKLSGSLPGLLALALSAPLPAFGQTETDLPDTFNTGIRRLTESQYRHTIRDLFGPDIQVQARFEPEQREGGLLAIGSAVLSLTSSGFEQYFSLASAISEQVLAESNRTDLMPCEPRSSETFDQACAAQFLNHYGPQLLRRPLTEAELAARLDTAEAGTRQSSDFYAGLKLALTSLLVAPEFLFRVEMAEPDPASPGNHRLTAYTKASRLSYLFWDTTPDPELLAAAASGELHTEAGLQAELNRLASSPRLQEGAEAFFTDMMQIDGFENLVKDPAIYPKFNQSVADSAREQMIRTIIDLLVVQERDYRELFISNETFINRPLAAVYQVPFVSEEEWVRYTFPADSERSGILTQVGFLSLFAHPGTSSPTRRGIKVHEIFMCEPTPDPPADVDFSSIQDSTKGTVRGRLLDHMENTGCTVCHRRSDPPGLALEHFDGLGQLRTMENGTLIDVSAELNGIEFEGARGLGKLLYEDQRVPACLVRNVFAYSVARKTDYPDRDYLRSQVTAFQNNGYRIPALMKQIASTPEFFEVIVPNLED